MARTVYMPWDYKQNELRNGVFQNLSSAPGSPVKGQFYFDTTLGGAYIYNGSAWAPCDATLAAIVRSLNGLTGALSIVNGSSGGINVAAAGSSVTLTIEIASGTSFPGSPASGQAFYRSDLKATFTYNGTSWIAGSLAQLADVALTSPANTQGLVYNGTSWVNQAIVNALAAGSDINLSSTTGTPTINLAIPSGTSWPGSPTTGQLYYRSDLLIMGYYNGSTWLVDALNATARPPDQNDFWTGGGTGATTQTATVGTNATSGDLLIAVVCALSSSANSLTAPAGYTQLGTTQSGGGVLIGVYYRTATGTTGDNCTATQANTTLLSVTVYQYDNAATPAGLTSASFTTVGKWSAPKITATVNDLIFCVFLPVTAVYATSALPQWGTAVMQYGAGNGPTFTSRVAAFADSYAGSVMFNAGATPTGLSAAFRIPAAN